MIIKTQYLDEKNIYFVYYQNEPWCHGHDKMSDYQKPIRFVLFIVILANTQFEGLLLPCFSSAEKEEIESAENISLFGILNFKKPLWSNLGDNNQVSLIREKSPLI